MNRDFFAGKKVLIMGLGRFAGGADSARFAAECGAEVTVTDLGDAEKLQDSLKQLEDLDIDYRLSEHVSDDFTKADIIIVNPAVPDDNEFLRIARGQEKYITTAMNIFLQLCPATTVGITGSNGKSTTAALTAHILKACLQQDDSGYSKVWLGGNIGNRPLLSNIDSIGQEDVVVLELSSFQTERFEQIELGPDIAVLVNLTANHLDRHGTFEQYCQAKEKMFYYQKPRLGRIPVSIFNAEDETGRQWYEKYSQQGQRKCELFCCDDLSEDARTGFALPGRANLCNLAAALKVAEQFAIPQHSVIESLGDFEPLCHRLEPVAEKNGLRYYNDSISTTPDSSIAALEAFERGRSIIIAGGYDKRLPFDALARKIADSAKAAVLIGQTAGKIAKAVEACPENKARIETADSLEEAVKKASELAEPGDVVLLSPACASYDMFDNFQQRGQRFVELVKSL